VNWLSDNYKWLFDGFAGAAAIAFVGYIVQRLFKSRPEPTGQETSLTAQGSKVTNSPVASGAGITQNVNSPTIHLSLHEPFKPKPIQLAASLEIVFLGDRKPYLAMMPNGVITGRVLLDRRYRIGVRNTSDATIANTRVVLENCEPSEHHGIHLAHALQVMDAQPGTSESSVRPGDDPRVFFDVVYDEMLGDQLRGDAFGLCYASSSKSYAIPRGTYVVTLRVESDGIQSRKKFKIFQDATTQMLTMRELDPSVNIELAGKEPTASFKLTDSPGPGPEVVLEYDYGVRNPLTVHNLSGGTAYHVQIATIRIDDRCTVAFENISHIGAGASVRVLPVVQDRYVKLDSDEGKAIKDDFAYVLEATYQTLGHDFDPVRLNLLVRYADRNGRKYQTHCEIEYDAFKKTTKIKNEPPQAVE
jgi:hypothetical protein